MRHRLRGRTRQSLRARTAPLRRRGRSSSWRAGRNGSRLWCRPGRLRSEGARALRIRSPRAPNTVIDDGAVDVGTIDVELDRSGEPLSLDVLCDGDGAFFLGSIRGRHGAGDNRREVQVACDVLLVPVEALRAALASVTHLAVAPPRCAGPAWGRPAGCECPPCGATSRSCARTLPEGLDIRAEKWLGYGVVEVTVHPALQRGDLPLHDIDGKRLLLRVTPVDVESSLDAGSE